MEMTNSGLTASDVLAMTRNNDDFGFGGVGAFILLFIFLMALNGNGFGFGGNGTTATMLGQSDIQNSLYFQSQDAAIRGLAQGQCAITDTVLSGKYDNALMMKDASQQLSNSIASIGNLIVEQGNQTRAMIQQNYINELSDKLSTTRDELSNVRQTGVLTTAMNAQTNDILNSLGKWRAYPPCYDTCGCNSSLY